MWKYALLISYVGTDYCGWQRQKATLSGNKPSIQQTLTELLLQMTGETVSLVGSGRTDSGVHAVGQVAHFVLKAKQWDAQILQRGLNGQLPRSIQVLLVQPVPLSFHAQRSATQKQYSYYFQQGPCPIPHLEPFSWWIYKKLDLTAMSRALGFLVGEHDFKPFQASGAKVGPTVRKILAADVTTQGIQFPSFGMSASFPASESSLVRVRVLGTGFLKQMVRGIAGTLLQVGEGRRPPECMQEILTTRNRQLVGPTAPARALWLENVWYSEGND